MLWRRGANSTVLSANNFGCVSQLFALVRPDIFLFFLLSTAVIIGCAFSLTSRFSSVPVYIWKLFLFKLNVSLSFLKFDFWEECCTRCSEFLLLQYNNSCTCFFFFTFNYICHDTGTGMSGIFMFDFVFCFFFTWSDFFLIPMKWYHHFLHLVEYVFAKRRCFRFKLWASSSELQKQKSSPRAVNRLWCWKSQKFISVKPAQPSHHQSVSRNQIICLAIRRQ